MPINPDKLMEILRDIEHATHYVIIYTVPADKAYDEKNEFSKNPEKQVYSVKSDDMYAASGLLRLGTTYVDEWIDGMAHDLHDTNDTETEDDD